MASAIHITSHIDQTVQNKFKFLLLKNIKHPWFMRYTIKTKKKPKQLGWNNRDFVWVVSLWGQNLANVFIFWNNGQRYGCVIWSQIRLEYRMRCSLVFCSVIMIWLGNKGFAKTKYSAYQYQSIEKDVMDRTAAREAEPSEERTKNMLKNSKKFEHYVVLDGIGKAFNGWNASTTNWFCWFDHRNFNEEKMQNSLSPKTRMHSLWSSQQKRKLLALLAIKHQCFNVQCLCWSETNSWIFFISLLIVSDKVRECFQFSMRNNEQKKTMSNRKRTEKMPITEKSCGCIVQINQPLTIPALHNAWNKNHFVTDYKKGLDSIDGLLFSFFFFTFSRYLHRLNPILHGYQSNVMRSDDNIEKLRFFSPTNKHGSNICRAVFVSVGKFIGCFTHN